MEQDRRGDDRAHADPEILEDIKGDLS